MVTGNGRAVLRLGLLTAQPDPNGCLRFMGGKDADGYGLFWLDGKMRRAHQVAWELANGTTWPQGLVARHTCNVRDCLNPQHVRPGTPKENRMDVVDAGNDPRANQTHCKRGHPLSGDNLLVKNRARGSYRACRTCQADHSRRCVRKVSENAG